MDSKSAVSILCTWHHHFQATLPTVDWVIIRWIPCIISYTIEREFWSFSMLHWVADESTHILLCEWSVQTINRTLQYKVANIVCYGIVPPEESRTLDATVDPIERTLCHIATNNITCPEHTYRWVEGLTIDAQWSVLICLCPQLRIVCRTNNQRSNVALRLYKLLCQTIQQLNLSVRVGSLAWNIIKEDSKWLHTSLIHEVKFVHKVLIVFLVPLDILTWMNSPNEVYTVLLAGCNKFSDILHLILWIRQTPVRRTVIRVVLRSIDISIHLVLTVEVNQWKAYCVWPWCTIETLHNTTIGKYWCIADFQTR